VLLAVALPSGGAALWREHGRLVLALYDGRVPLQVQVLSGTDEVGEESGREVGLILLSLQGDEALENRMPTALEMAVADTPPSALEAFAEVVGLPVEEAGRALRAVPQPQARDRLLPDEVGRIRRRRKSRKRAALVGAVVLVAYLVPLAWLWLHARGRTAEIASLERQVEIVAPDVERIQRIEQRWKVLEPAFDKKWFPVVQLNDIASALPASGVVVREFRTSGREVRVTGQARDVQLANRLLEDLQAMEAFSEYAWSMPNPEVERNNTATFVISGEPKNAGVDG